MLPPQRALRHAVTLGRPQWTLRVKTPAPTTKKPCYVPPCAHTVGESLKLCASNGVTYASQCEFVYPQCIDPSLYVVHYGACDAVTAKPTTPVPTTPVPTTPCLVRPCATLLNESVCG